MRPTTISVAIGQAKLIEAKLKENQGTSPSPRIFASPRSFAPAQNQNFSSQNKLPNTPDPNRLQNPSNLPLLPAPPKTTSNIPFRRLSDVEAREKRAKCLCFSCDEKWVRGHQCKSPQFFLIKHEGEDRKELYIDSGKPAQEHELGLAPTELEVPTTLLEPNHDSELVELQLSTTAFFTMANSQTLRVSRDIRGR